MNPVWIPVALTAGVVAVLASQRQAPAPPPPPLPGLPVPIPTGPGTLPQLPPGPLSGDTASLLTQAQTVIAQAVANPASVQPDRIGFLAQQLRAAGRPVEAGQLEAVGPAVCAARGLDSECWRPRIQAAPAPVLAPSPAASVPTPPAPAPDPQQAAARVALDQQAFLAIAAADAGLRNQVPFNQINWKGLQQMITPLRAAGLNERADQASTAAGRVLGAIEGFKIPPNPNPSALTGDLLAGMQAIFAPGSTVGSKKADALLQVLNLTFPNGFLAEKQVLQQRINDLVAQGR